MGRGNFFPGFFQRAVRSRFRFFVLHKLFYGLLRPGIGLDFFFGFGTDEYFSVRACGGSVRSPWAGGFRFFLVPWKKFPLFGLVGAALGVMAGGFRVFFFRGTFFPFFSNEQSILGSVFCSVEIFLWFVKAGWGDKTIGLDIF